MKKNSKNEYLDREQDKFHPKKKIWSHISGIDLIRNIDGKFLVLEDNLRVPSGVSYMLENRMVMGEVFPELLRAIEFHRSITIVIDSIIVC